jgi:dienelactone hydrolase
VSSLHSLRNDPDELLCALFFERPAPAALAAARCLRFEYTSRGDRVNGRLLLPAQGGERRPLALVGHGAGGANDAPYMDAVAGPWVRAGTAVASIDFPLHGERRSAKLSERLLAALAGAGRTDGLALDFAAQAVLDLRRALDALSAHPEVDVSRSVYAGFSLGTILGALFCASEPRVRAAALAVGGAGFGPEAIDPAHHIARFAPRPVLFVNATRDDRIPRAHAEAPPPPRSYRCSGSGTRTPGRALKAMWGFLAPHLEP